MGRKTEATIPRTSATFWHSYHGLVACLGAGRLEEESIYPSQKFKSLILNDKENDCEEDRFWKRFIDDIVAATQSSREEA